MYDVTGAPPSDVGTAHTSAAVPSEATTLRLTGAVGGVRGAIAPESDTDEPVPAALRAEMRKRYVEPFAKPDTTAERSAVVTTVCHEIPPSVDCSTT
jgi:hypothetical protein